MAVSAELARWVLSKRYDVEQGICQSSANICGQGDVRILSEWWYQLRPHAPTDPAYGFVANEAGLIEYARSLGYTDRTGGTNGGTTLTAAQVCAQAGLGFNPATGRCTQPASSDDKSQIGEVMGFIGKYPVWFGLGAGAVLLFLMGKLKSG